MSARHPSPACILMTDVNGNTIDVDTKNCMSAVTTISGSPYDPVVLVPISLSFRYRIVTETNPSVVYGDSLFVNYQASYYLASTQDDHDNNPCSTNGLNGLLYAKAGYDDGPYTIKVISRGSDQVITLPTERLFETHYGHYCGLVHEQTLTPVVSSTDLLIDSSNQFFSVKANAATQNH